MDINKERACKKVLRGTGKVQIRDVGRYLDRVKYKWFNKGKSL